VLAKPKPPAALASPESTTSVSVSRGFDDNGEPFIEERQTEGTLIHRTPRGETITKPDGSQVEMRKSAIQGPMPTPPELPADPTQGRVWVERHNAELLRLITQLVDDSTSEMEKFAAAEKTKAGDDLFAQILYRTSIANFLAAAR